MGISQSFGVALRALTVNRLRSALTMLGIIIGVAAVVALISIGKGAEKMVTEEIGSMGSNLVIITGRGQNRLTPEDAAFILERVDNLTLAMPTIQASGEAAWKGNSLLSQVQGVTEIFPDLRSLKTSQGRFLLKTDVSMRRKVCVIGHTVLQEIFDGEDPIGEKLSVLGQPLTVVGVMEEMGGSMAMDQDNIVFTPLTTLQRLVGTTNVSAIYAQVGDEKKADSAVKSISQIFDSKFRRGDTVSVMSQKQLIDIVSKVTGTFTILLASIAGISLLVGGIGIMNIMFVSVTERTREIGLRKAVGGKYRDILIQFLIESSMLSGFGGLVGIILGSYAANIIATIGGWTPYVSPQSVALAMSFSVGVGVFFGLYPAMRAAKMNPINALRYE